MSDREEALKLAEQFGLAPVLDGMILKRIDTEELKDSLVEFYRAVRDQAQRELLDEAREPVAHVEHHEFGAARALWKQVFRTKAAVPTGMALYLHPFNESAIRKMERERLRNALLYFDGRMERWFDEAIRKLED